MGCCQWLDSLQSALVLHMSGQKLLAHGSDVNPPAGPIPSGWGRRPPAGYQLPYLQQLWLEDMQLTGAALLQAADSALPSEYTLMFTVPPGPFSPAQPTGLLCCLPLAWT